MKHTSVKVFHAETWFSAMPHVLRYKFTVNVPVFGLWCRGMLLANGTTSPVWYWPLKPRRPCLVNGLCGCVTSFAARAPLTEYPHDV